MSSYIKAKNISLDYPILGYRGESLKSSIINNTIGGIIKIQGLSNKATTVRSVNNISLEAFPGDKVGLIGSNGCGKTSLLRVLSGVYPISEGQLKVKGRLSSMLNLNCGIDSELTGLDNIIFRLKLARINQKDISNMIDDIINFADLNNFINLPFRMYSSGMQARLVFGIATAVPSDIILMDEWLSVGDKDFNKKAAIRLNDYVKKSSILILASHDHKFVSNLCNKIITMDHGEMIDYKEQKI
jgi:lipopolysaccharide transport system ATP-binding protein